MKVILFFLLIFFYILKKVIPKIKHKTKECAKECTGPLDSDIILAPGGYKGIYMIGICHYIKNHFNLSSKSCVGFSCGSFNALFMKLKPELDHKYLRLLFALNHRLSMSQMLSNVVSTVKTNFVYKDFDLRQTKIGITTSSGLELFQDFDSIEDVTDCCRCSSFVPFITQNDVFLFYKNKLTLDGGVYYKRLKKTKRKESLLVSSSMFGRYKDSLISGFRKPKCSYYQLYLYGYSDAQKNHAFLASYF